MKKQTSLQLVPCVVFATVISLVVSLDQAVAASPAPPEPATYALLENFHGHVCAGSLFGARLGKAARDALKEAGGTGKFTARYYDLSCPVDGIQVAAGTTYGNTAMTVDDRNEHRLVLTAAGNKLAVEARLTKRAEALSLRSRDLGKQVKSLPEQSAERKRLEREVQEIFEWLRTASTSDIVTVTPVVGKSTPHVP